ncbi:hypothetical protein [Streptomyces sp. 35G-GA-8]|uniref:hypothetical protein n=1 Tax=Streptomyces sp. 35G-GA-8 TaxID=2939434 RepID=UPI00201E7BE9|nr:hypothetical protein [Streptomyces sp. 35G-GA-8]MCL7382587.1 hypothetical protein [Streptomyces sp. 35G-GA-8]
MNDIITLADDPDLAHLVDLIDILPRPEASRFWDEKGQGDHSIGAKIGQDLKRILGGQGRPRDVDYFAVHVLKYLGRGNVYISEEKITQNLRSVHGLPAAGHAWVEDTTRTAWRLVTRYSLARWRGAASTPGSAWMAT